MITPNESLTTDKFEEWLMDRYILEENPLDDMIPDGFADWICELDVDDWLIYGNKFCHAEKLAMIKRLEKGLISGKTIV